MEYAHILNSRSREHLGCRTEKIKELESVDADVGRRGFRIVVITKCHAGGSIHVMERYVLAVVEVL